MNLIPLKDKNCLDDQLHTCMHGALYIEGCYQHMIPPTFKSTNHKKYKRRLENIKRKWVL